MAVAVGFIMALDRVAVERERAPEAAALAVLAGFRADVYWSFTRRADASFELCDAVLCAPGRVTDLARLSLAAEFRRGHGALYDALNCGHAGFSRLRRALAGLPLPAWDDGRIRLAVDVSHWLRPGARASPERLLCAVKGRGKNAAAQPVPGWPYSFVAALGPGRSSWTLPLDVARLGPDDDECLVTAAQLRDVVTRLTAAGQWEPGDPEIIIAADAGYNATRLALLLDGLPVIIVARVRADRVFWAPAPPRAPGKAGHPARHGPPVRCADPATQAGPPLEQAGHDARHGPLAVAAWPRLHQKVHRNTAGFEDWPPGRPFPVTEGTLIRLTAARPARAAGRPMWLWASAPDAGQGLLAVLWQAYLRRFDIEHTFRFLKQQLGWTRPLLRDPAAADRWTWLVAAALAQLWIARRLAAVTRLPWHPPRPPGTAEMTPGQARAGFRRAREIAGTPASPAKPARPGPGRPKGSKNKRKAPRQPVGKHQLKPSTQRTNASRKARKQKQTG
jgi:DDE superfamily endonuclease